MLKWWFIDGWWSAVSKIDDNGDSLDWRSEWQIKVTNKGRFSVSHSSPERDTHKETFATFEEAANWCQELENTLHTQPAKEPVAEAITFDKCSPEKVSVMLKWFFIDGWWSAASKIHDNGDPFEWRIKVTKEGRFSVSDSSPELTERKETFATFEEAVQWCRSVEEKFIAEAKATADAEKCVSTTGINADVAYGHADAEQPVAAIVQPANNQVGKTGSLVWYFQLSGCEFVAFSSHFQNKKPALWTLSDFKGYSCAVDFSDKSYTAIQNMILEKGRFDSIKAAQAFCQELEDLFAVDFKGLAEVAVASDSGELVSKAIRLAVQMYSGDMQNDGERIFNATTFANAMQRLANTDCKLDNAMVDAILRGRDDVEKGNGFYYRFAGDEKKAATVELSKPLTIQALDIISESRKLNEQQILNAVQVEQDAKFMETVFGEVKGAVPTHEETKQLIVIGGLPGTVKNTGSKYWDGQEVHTLECPYPDKCRVRSKKSDDITWVAADCLVTPSF